MQFFQTRDNDSKVWHNYLVIQVSKQGYLSLKATITQSPATCWPLIQNGKPTLVFGYGATINLSEEFGSGETLGDKLHVGDIVTVILTDKPQEGLLTQKDTGLTINVALEEVTVYLFTYTQEMAQLYQFYTGYIHQKA